MSKRGGGGLLTAQEVIDHYPELEKKHGFNAKMIGLLLRHHVLWGMYDSGKRMHLIEDESVELFIEYLNKVLSQHIISKKD